GHGDRIKLEIGKDLRDLDAVRHVRLTGVAGLAPVRLFAEPVGAHEQVLIEPLIRALDQAPARNDLAYRCSCHCSYPLPVTRYPCLHLTFLRYPETSTSAPCNCPLTAAPPRQNSCTGPAR